VVVPVNGAFDILMIVHHRAPELPPIFSTFEYDRGFIATKVESSEDLIRISVSAGK
jgi:hypothetical protein